MKNYRETKDDALVELTLLGNEKAYEELVIRHQKAVKGTAYKVTGNEFSAEDASQDAFVAAWMHLDSLRERDKFGSWVCSIAKNCARTLVAHYRSCAPDISLHILQDMELTANDESGLLAMLAEGGMGEAVRDEQLHTAVDALSEKIREAITMHYFDGLSVAQIAAKLSLPEGTVKWRLCEGRKQLRKEYGVMEQTYNENESMVERVMRQVEALKMWRLKNDKTGIEEEYRAVLAAVKALDDSEGKHHALADVLLRGVWWIPGERSDEIWEQIKESAEKGHNDDVMQSVMCAEHDKIQDTQERVNFMRDVQIPYLEQHGFVKTLAYNYFWMGHYLCDLKQYEEGLACFEKTRALLTPMDVYYANAISALAAWQFRVANKEEHEEKLAWHATGEELRYIGNKLYFWQQPGFSHGGASDCDDSLLWQASQCDNLIYDPDMKLGELKISSDGKFSLALKAKDITVTTSAGTFEHCDVLVQKVIGVPEYGMKYAETTFCPGVGIVRQYVQRYEGLFEWQLSAYELCGGEGVIPFAAGNRWDYEMVTEIGVLRDVVSRFEITGAQDGQAVMYHLSTVQICGYLDTWQGNMLQARQQYCHYVGYDEEKLCEIRPSLVRAAAQATTKREKVHTEIATDVMNRIFDTDSDTAPERTQAGFWNFFDIFEINRDEAEESISFDSGRTYSFEWKNWCRGKEACKVLNNFVYDILKGATGCVWSDKWVPGYHKVRKFKRWHEDCETIMDVTGGETVVTPVGTFENCLCLSLDIKGMAKYVAYRGGKKQYWFAPGVGIVKYTFFYDYRKTEIEGTYLLTEMRGTGEGYFPCEDGMFRRYDVIEIENGWHGAVEYTWDISDGETIIFRNATGTQDIENYTADQARFKEEDARRKAEKEAKKKAEEEAKKKAEEEALKE